MKGKNIEEREKKLVVKNLYKVFGDNPKQAMKMVHKGQNKEEIFRKTGMTIGVQNAEFEVYKGEIFVIMGLSGSGKSTLVRLLNRLIEPTSGQIFIDDIEVTNLSDKKLQNIRRNKISMVFQSFALMPHLNILDNTAFGLDLSGVSKSERYEKANAALKQVGLENYGDVYPDELSGGMQQRVGLARALANDPDILLMDEAFSALDPLIRTEMQDELLNLQNEQERTIVFISHDLDEAIRIGDRIAIMENANIAQIGTPEEIISNPANDYVKSFFKGVNVTSVLSASHIARKSNLTIVKKEGSGIKSAMQYMSDYDRDFGFFVEKNNKYLGCLTMASLSKQQKLGGTIYDAIIEQETILENTPISDIISVVASHKNPIAVVGEDGKYKGSISKSILLETFDEGYINE
ncbi:glycine betaine/L-proline ABC transporter ATP-binding protein ProV [Sulfurospirillum sp. 1612]|uniref:glycine betaine/L-proline ABC transporter ATP-binding protein ProV n=1 Tax=Sulfurospirillum sp. 1612 TaxID=3094835 RepID=UPI002F94BAF9